MGREKYYDSINNYNREKYDRINLMIPKGERETWKAEAEKRGLSLNALIQQAVKNYIESEVNK